MGFILFFFITLCDNLMSHEEEEFNPVTSSNITPSVNGPGDVRTGVGQGNIGYGDYIELIENMNNNNTQ